MNASGFGDGDSDGDDDASESVEDIGLPGGDISTVFGVPGGTFSSSNLSNDKDPLKCEYFVFLLLSLLHASDSVGTSSSSIHLRLSVKFVRYCERASKTKANSKIRNDPQMINRFSGRVD